MSDQIVLEINAGNKNNWKNCIGTSDRPKCKCGSWEQHWKNFSEAAWPKKCSKVGCINPAEVGAHVKRGGISGEWIVPLCKDCNSINSLSFSLEERRILVSANRSKTCD